MDGVLLDSEEITSKAAISYFAKKGFCVAMEDFLPFYGTGENGFFGGVAQKHGIPYNNDLEAEEIYKIYADLAKGKVKPLAGVLDFIAICKRNGLKLAVATSAGEMKMRVNLQLLNFEHDTFDALVCGKDITYNKPNPEIFVSAAKKLNLQPCDCLVIEDAPSGVRAAKDAGARCLALLTSFSRTELAQADWIVRDLADYPKEIFSFHE